MVSGLKKAQYGAKVQKQSQPGTALPAEAGAPERFDAGGIRL
jgi:hypothetical protein